MYGYKDGKICFLGKWLDNSMYPCDAPVGLDIDGNLVYMEDLEGEKQKEPHYTKMNTLFDKCVENCDPAIMKEVSDNVDKMMEKEQKLAEWSDKDEEMRQDTIRFIETGWTDNGKSHLIPWLKALPERVNLQPKQEWSEEDEDMLLSAIEYVQSYPAHRQSVVNWLQCKLKSLRPQPHWKPSEEQMKDLEQETRKWWKEHLHLNPENKLWMDAHQSVVFARHFYELGINTRKEE